MLLSKEQMHKINIITYKNFLLLILGWNAMRVQIDFILQLPKLNKLKPN